MVIYILTDSENRVTEWSSCPFDERAIEVTIDDNHPFLEGIPMGYMLINGEIAEYDNSHEIFEAKREGKIQNLSQSCQEAILSRFPVTIDDQEYTFSYDEEAQANLSERWQLFQNNMIGEITVTARDSTGERVRITLNTSQFNKVYLASVLHKENHIKHFRDELVPLVNQAKTEEQLNAITWDTQVVVPAPEAIKLVDEATLNKELGHVRNESAKKTNELLGILAMLMMGGT